MSFEIDNQTLNDLNIFPKQKKDNSIFKIFDKTKTSGGQNALIQIMKEPSDDFELLTSRIGAIQFFQNNTTPFHFTEKMLDFIEHYLNQNVPPLKEGWFYTISDLITNAFQDTNEYYIIEKGLRYLHFFIQQLKSYVDFLEKAKAPIFFQNVINEANTIIKDKIIQQLVFVGLKNEDAPFINKGILNKFNAFSTTMKWYFSINHFDNIIRNEKKDNILKLIKYIYQLDVLITLAQKGKENNFCLPSYKKNGSSFVKIEKIFHPFVNEPVTNDISLEKKSNMCFLTGVNMAGKSTFLKSVGLCSYLAHLGFPVPAAKMETSIFSGLITTINLADDISIGYSHFYSEVKRVKNTALKIKEKKKILVIFDELFRGTNVKDAYDASLMIIAAFAKIKQCTFFISTHIVEIAEELKNEDNIIFKYFESDVVNEIPIYSYKLANGVSADRHGLRIVKNEKIVEILEGINEEL